MTSSESDLENVGLIAVMIIICFLGAACNTVVIYVVLFNRKMRGSTDLFVVNLSIGDILLAGIALPLKLNTALFHDGDFHAGDTGCKLIQFIPQFSIMCSITTMMAISFDRWISITKQKHMSMGTTIIIIFTIWIISLATSAPQLYEYSVKDVKEEYGNDTRIICGSHDIPENFETVYAIIILVVSYLFPLLVIAANYCRLGVFLWKRKRPGSLGQQTGQNGNQSTRNKTRIIKLLMGLTIVFAVLWLPYFVLFTITEITDTDNSSEAASAAHSAKNLMIALSTVTNPVLYSLFNRAFREGVVKAFSWCKRPNRVNDMPPSQITGKIFSW